MGWRGGSLFLVILVAALGLSCGGEEVSPAATPVVVLPGGGEGTITPFVAGTRPVFPTDTPAPTATPVVEEGEGLAEVVAAMSDRGSAVDDERDTDGPPVAVGDLGEPCSRGVIGQTGITLVDESFFASHVNEPPRVWPGLESDFYLAHDLRWLMLTLRFEVPEGVSATGVSFRFGRVLGDGLVLMLSEGEWKALEPGGVEVMTAAVGGDEPGSWSEGLYFVDVRAVGQDCAILSWFFEVHG